MKGFGKMNYTRIDRALELLDIHYNYYKENKRDKEQKAYYDGLKDMLENVLSNCYTENYYIKRNEYGKHFVSCGNIYEKHPCPLLSLLLMYSIIPSIFLLSNTYTFLSLLT